MYEATLLGVPLYYVLWFFYIFCVLGVVLEMIFCLAREGVIESRLGVLYLPLSPIYGFGGVALSLFLRPYIGEPVLMFFVGIAVGTIVEYVASFVMEKSFKTVFWDYSDKPLNLHGRVCLQYSTYWGLLSLLLLNVIDKWAYAFVQLFTTSTGTAILTVLNVLTILTILLTLAAFTRMQHKVSELTSKVPAGQRRDTAIGRLVDRLAPDSVVINTFPRMSLVNDYSELTGLQRKWIRLDLHLGTPSRIHERMRQRAAERARIAV